MVQEKWRSTIQMITKQREPVASIVMAAGRGSRMKGYSGNKTLLPLIPERSPFTGRHSILAHIMESLPDGPKAVVVNHCREDVVAAARSFDAVFIDQPILNGTGGAILAARDFLCDCPCDRVIITMGDVPFIRRETYQRMIERLEEVEMNVLGFRPDDKKRYGVLETDGSRVKCIVEWKYWHQLPEPDQVRYSICNTGIYAARRRFLLNYLDVLSSRPQQVRKEIDGRWVEIEEFFLTDLAEIMALDGCPMGFTVAGDETETMGVDDLDALEKAQTVFRTIG